MSQVVPGTPDVPTIVLEHDSAAVTERHSTAAPSEPVVFVDRIFKPVMPDHIYDLQYKRSHQIGRSSQSTVIVRPYNVVKYWNDEQWASSTASVQHPCDMQDSDDRPLMDDWQALTSPEGRPYFYCAAQKCYTQTYLPAETSALMHEVVAKAKALRESLLEQHRDSMTTELFLEFHPFEERWVYYFADTERRTIFWIQDISLDKIIQSNPRFVVSHGHLSLQLEAQYCGPTNLTDPWRAKRLHIEMFSHDRKVARELLDEVKDLLVLGYHDMMTSSTSTAPYSKESIRDALDGLDRVRVGECRGIGVWAIARYMHTIKREMFIHYYGQQGARLNRDQSVYDDSIHKERSNLFLLGSPLLFFMPDVYIRKLEEMYVDETINVTPWNSFWDDMRRDWERATTPVTVLLSTNVGFLAIQSIDAASGAPHRSVAQIASYASTILSLACYIICWTLSRQHPPGSNNTAEAAIVYLAKREQSILGLEADALIYSLPTALFTWSMLTFLVSMTWICFAGTDAITRSLIAILLFVMTGVVIGVLHADWGAIAPADDSLVRRFWRGITSFSQRLYENVWTNLVDAARCCCLKRHRPSILPTTSLSEKST